MICRMPMVLPMLILSLVWRGFAWAIVPATVPVAEPTDLSAQLAQATTGVANPGDRASLSAVKSAAQESIDETPLLEFVEKHQPALLKLLKFMKKKQPQQYEQAIKELSRVRQRLTNLEKRDVESYAIELELWQVRSKLRMLVAEILVTEKDLQEKLKTQLHELVQKEFNLESARLKLDENRFEQRLRQVQSQLRDRESDRDATLAKALKAWEIRALKPPSRSKKL